ncbi:hypothetical protein EB796_007374 [Bugula neritina]|uniref:Uncharacterized protein n=1 Tax=Bugula neritina TaxID=10212 RepID=A0A7J7K8Y9_BUGNE|nr:hypothetical protein EB796_007374 [Bugula neritina]
MSVYAEDGNIRIQYTNNSSNATNKKESSLHLALSPETNPESDSMRTFTMIFRNNELYRSFDKSVRPAGLIASVSLSTFTGSPVSISDTDNAIRLSFTDLVHSYPLSLSL